MTENIYQCDKFIFLASDNTLKSKYVLYELTHARDRAIQLLPESFIHIVCITTDKSLNYLPAPLKAFLCHLAYDKSELLLFYEIFLGLFDIPIGDLIIKMLKHNPISKWIMLERYQIIELLNESGDVRMKTIRTVLNSTTENQRYDSLMNMWRIGTTNFDELEFKMLDDNGEEIPYQIKEESFRGKDSLKYKIGIDKTLLPNELFSFTTEYMCKNGFELKTGGEYNFPTEDMVYGYYRLDVSFPRDSNPEIPILKIIDKNNEYKIRLDNQGCNKFAYSKINVDPGIDFNFLFKLKTTGHNRRS